jgi:hypothetical protein
MHAFVLRPVWLVVAMGQRPSVRGRRCRQNKVGGEGRNRGGRGNGLASPPAACYRWSSEPGAGLHVSPACAAARAMIPMMRLCLAWWGLDRRVVGVLLRAGQRSLAAARIGICFNSAVRACTAGLDLGPCFLFSP